MKAKRIFISPKALQILGDFERQLDTNNPERGKYAVKIIGYGEMSTVFKFDEKPLSGLAFKRMALFETEAEAIEYEKLYLAYHEVLNTVGINTPDYGCHKVLSALGKPVLFLSQKLLKPDTIGHKLIHQVDETQACALFREILKSVDKVMRYNVNNPGEEIGIDAQLSNWSFLINKKGSLRYLDTSTPLMKKNGVEQLNTELFLRICPSSLVWIIRLLFLKDVVTRYYDIRLVITDLIANLYKEKKPDLIPAYTEIANSFLRNNYPQMKPVTEKEINDYYRQDALIWRIFMFFRRLEKFTRQKILRRKYNLILPGKVSR